MSDFQLSLLAIGATIVVAVFAYNKWQEARARRAATQAFESKHDDVLAGATDIARKPARTDGSASRIEPVLESVSRAPADETSPRADAISIEYTMEMAAESPISGAIVQEHWQSSEHRFAGRSRILGGEGAAQARIEPGGVYRRLEASLQLVSRAGVVSEGELLEFRSAVEALAARLGVSVKATEMREALDRARKLDQICAESDIEVAFHVLSADGQSVNPAALRDLSIAAGLSPRPGGGFSFRDSEGREIFAVAEREEPMQAGSRAMRRLTISMDVPRVPETQMSFELMVGVARQIAEGLGGGLVDDNGRPIDDKSLRSIAQQLAGVRATLEAAGVVPGSDLALRLFS